MTNAKASLLLYKESYKAVFIHIKLAAVLAAFTSSSDFLIAMRQLVYSRLFALIIRSDILYML